MALLVYKISEYDHIAESEQFESVVQQLRLAYENDATNSCILIGNYNIEGVELDALIVNKGGARILEFKNWGGRIIARENGSWTSNNMIIEGGAGKKSPYEQIRLNKSRVAKGLASQLSIKPENISAAIIFAQDSEIDSSQLSDTVKMWLTVCDNAHLNMALSGLDKPVFSNEFLLSVPSKLRIEEFAIDKKNQRSVVINETFEPESATNFFEDLETAVNYRPDFHKVYQSYNQIFQKFLNQQTSQLRLNLGSPFAKTDYLLKEHRASRRLFKTTNDTRTRLRKYHEQSESDLQKFYLVDLKNLCQFIAFICNCNIPVTLIGLFPTEIVPSFTPLLVSECMRAIVEQWDNDFVYVQAEDSTDEDLTKVCYSRGNTIYNYDWSYLKGMFYKGAQLNLIRPREDDGIIYPELIVFEPDYLVNISTVAHCFTNYADSPFVELIKKLEPSITNEAIVLGNFAGQLLDESIHQLPNTYSYANSVNEFFRNNAIGLLTAGVGPEFHSKAQKQKQNITKAIRSILPEEVQGFNSKEGIVEPSFFSEMLGLQGRMDYLQLDFKVLLEQKSGKGAFPYDNFIKPRQTDEHYVQMLLYIALIRYNYRAIYERNNGIRAFLLYSKYSESLLDPGYAASELLFKAIKVRNGIAWTEMLYTQPNGYRILDGLTPDRLNMKKVNNPLWNNYQMDQISRVLNPIREASELEKAYYFRFLTFIANEHVMSKLGNKTKESSGFAATWHDSLSEKLAAGNIYDNLILDEPTSETIGIVKSVTLKFSEKADNDMSNFRTGDIVILYPYERGKEPDARKTMVFRCTIEEILSDKIILALRASQSDNRVFVKDCDKLWAIEHDFMESSYSSLYKGMQAFLSAPKQRRDLILLQREPETDNSIELKGDYGSFNELALSVKRAKDLFLIIGPPGTGKTSFGLLYTVKEELLEQDTNVLLLSYTNRAVDEICSKLEKEGIGFIRIGNPLTCAEEYRNRLLSEIARDTPKVSELERKLLTTRVVVGTTTSLNSNIALFNLKQFSLAVIDEASQILEPHLIGLLSANNNNGEPAIRKIVLIGDHKQLPAVVQQKPDVSKVHDLILNDIYLTDCRLSLFERFLKKYNKNKDVVGGLKKQGRMHPDIALFPNYTFYQNTLEAVPMPHQKISLPVSGTGRNGIDDLLATRRIAFIASETPNNSPTDKVNQNEADLIAALVVKIYEKEKNCGFDVNATVGVIVPYRNQIAAVRKTIDRYGIDILHNITIDTVERYQGSQRKYIIYGFTIQKYYQLNFLTNNVFEDIDGTIVDRKLNVAMTRAEEHLIMIGNPELLSNNFTFFKLIEFVNSKHGLFKVNKEDFVSGQFSVPQYEIEEFDLSRATYTTSAPFDNAYEKHVLQPVKDGSGQEWPSKVFGHDMAENLNAIGYGRINFSNQLQLFGENQMPPSRQVLIYCYYIMRQHYCSSMNLYSSYQEWIKGQMSSVNGRVQMIDIGCGPATCGISFAEQFKSDAPNMVYTGIDVSTEMKRMGKNMLADTIPGEFHYQMIDSFNALDNIFWDGCSELPSLIIFNMSYFFSNVTAQFTERLASQMIKVMKNYSLNKYVFFIQHSEYDKNLNSYKVFKQVLNPYIVVNKSEKSSFSYILNYKERHLDFCYDIFTNR